MTESNVRLEIERLVKKLRTKTERVHDLSGVGYNDDADCYRAADLLEALALRTPSDGEVVGRFLKDETTPWQVDSEAGSVTVHSRMVDGVLCRWWGDGPAPAGVAVIDKALAAQSDFWAEKYLSAITPGKE